MNNLLLDMSFLEDSYFAVPIYEELFLIHQPQEEMVNTKFHLRFQHRIKERALTWLLISPEAQICFSWGICKRNPHCHHSRRFWTTPEKWHHSSIDRIAESLHSCRVPGFLEKHMRTHSVSINIPNWFDGNPTTIYTSIKATRGEIIQILYPCISYRVPLILHIEVCIRIARQRWQWARLAPRVA